MTLGDKMRTSAFNERNRDQAEGEKYTRGRNSQAGLPS